MWSAPIHDSEFVAKVLDHLENNESQYGTAVRMKGMLTVAKEVRDITGYPLIVTIATGTPQCAVLLYAFQSV